MDAIDREWAKRKQVAKSIAGPTAHQAPTNEAGRSWDPHGILADALRSIVATYGVESLSDEKTLGNRLSDLVDPGSLRREQSLVLAASRQGVRVDLQERISQGLGIDSAVRLAAVTLSEKEPFDLSLCEWVTRTFAQALGYPDTTTELKLDLSTSSSPVTYRPPEFVSGETLDEGVDRSRVGHVSHASEAEEAGASFEQATVTVSVPTAFDSARAG